MKRILLALGFALGTASSSHAAVIVSAVGATATSEFGAGSEIELTIDQSGLSSNYVSGVTNFDTYLGTNPTHTLVAIGNEWFSAAAASSATVVYDLGASIKMDRFALWHEESSGFTSALMSSSIDGLTFTGLPTISPVGNPVGSDYGAQVFHFGGTIMARYIQLDLRGCPDPTGNFDACAIGEVAFSSPVPIPGALIFLLTGVGGLAIVRKRTQV